jgi:hypothetical protein
VRRQSEAATALWISKAAGRIDPRALFDLYKK